MYVPAPPVTPLAGFEPPGFKASAPRGEPAISSLRVRTRSRHVLAGHPVSVRGRLIAGGSSTSLPGLTVVLQMLGRRWATVAHARTGGSGGFLLRFVPRHIGSARLRVRFAGEHGVLLASRRRIGRLNVYRPVQASWYGGAGSLACGGRLTSATMGVANRTLPCGTLVTLHLGSRTVRVPVVDRGPFVGAREFDLTSATRQALGFGDTGEIWSTV